MSVVTSGLPDEVRPSHAGGTNACGAALTLLRVVSGTTEPPVAATPGVTLRVPPGQSVALLSRPASTSADLLDVVGGLRRARTGQVFVDDVAVHRLRGPQLDHYRGSRGLVSTRWPLLPSLSVTDNVLAALLSRRVDAQARDRAAQLLSVTGADQIAARPVESLTAEQQWRILIARALLQSPRLVLAEDPTPDLDPRNANAILDLIMEAHSLLGFTLLLSVSRTATASRCQRLVSLEDGAIIEDELIVSDDAWTRGRIDRIG